MSSACGGGGGGGEDKLWCCSVSFRFVKAVVVMR